MTRAPRAISSQAAAAMDAIHTVVMAIPAGHVATYGQVAEIAGLPRRARLVGYALKHLPENSEVPWHRVINAAGRVSERSGPRDSGRDQRQLLMAEGVVFGTTGRVDLAKYRWDPDGEISG